MTTPSTDIRPDVSTGLSHQAAAQRLRHHGPNELPGEGKPRWLALLRETLGEPMFLLLVLAGGLYLLLGDLQEGLVLFAMVLVVLALTLYQEGRTERALQTLRQLSSPRAVVVRDGQRTTVAGRELVPGDLLLLGEGDRVAADAVLIDGAELELDESLLTGESLPVSKVQQSDPGIHAGTGTHASAPVGSAEGAGHLYAGTLVVRGHGMARVVATGAASQMGRIGQALAELETEDSPLKRQTARLVKVLAVVALVASVLLVLLQGFSQGQWMPALLSGIALAMALLPQEFTVVLTVLPALGAWRLAREKVLTRRIAAIETLGAASVLCVDKTGTLTENRMTVAALYAQQGAGAGQLPVEHRLEVDYGAPSALPEEFHTLVEYSILASLAEPFDPMEKAFHQLGQHFLEGTEHLHRDWTLAREYGLTSQLRAMSHVWRATVGQAHVVAAKGAPEAIIDLCHLDDEQQARIAAAARSMAEQGLRVLGVASARFEGEQWPQGEHDFEFEFLGLLGMADPLRREIPGAVALCRNAGIRVMMITGDYPATASAIAERAGLPVGAGHLLTGEEIGSLDDAALSARLATASVCARVAPGQKLRIVQTLQSDGAVVAMTGDGVNDAPALKAAHVGVAMGARGTDVAREAASLVLLDDNFESIVRAVRLGRRIYDNLRKSMSYILAVHIPIAGMALLPTLLGWPVMLYPLHIAFLELVIDPACSAVFENEPAESDVMGLPPRDPQSPLLDRPTLTAALLQGLAVLAITALVADWALANLPQAQARALSFVVLVTGNMALIFGNRSLHRPVWSTLATPNRVLWLVVLAALLMTAAAVYVPALAAFFYFTSLPPSLLLVALGTVAASLLCCELLRRFSPGVRARGAPSRG